MSIETSPPDHYEAVLADLRAQRDKITQAIELIESLRGGPRAEPRPQAEQVSQNDSGGPGDYLGMTIADAARKLLASRRRTLTNAEIADGLKRGGLVMQSVDAMNTIGTVLTRRFNQVGDIVRVDRGTWGLQEWYPNRNFKKKPPADVKGDVPPSGVVGDFTLSEPTETAPPYAPPLTVVQG